MILLGNGPGVLATQDPAQAFLHGLKGKPIASRRERIALLAVLFVCIRVPRAAAHALDQRGADAVAFDRQRMIGVGHIDVLHLFEIDIDILRASRRRRKLFDDWATHLLPHETDAAGVRRRLAPRERQIDPAFERVLFAHAVPGSAHGVHDIIGNTVAPDVTESACEPPGDLAVPALEKAVQHLRSIPDRRKRCARVGGIALEERGRAGNQRCGQ